MTKETKNNKDTTKIGAMSVKLELPKLPDDFRGAQYGNRVSMSATAQEVFLDLFQIGPEAGGRREAKAVFMGRVIFPLTIAKEVLSQLQGLVESIEKDAGIEVPAPEEVTS